MTRAPSRNGSSKDSKKGNAKGKSAKKSRKSRTTQSKTPPPSPDSIVSSAPSPSDSVGEKEQRSRRSLRLGNSVVDFKALSSRGRDYLNQNFSETRTSGRRGFVAKQIFSSYDELMRFTKDYEREHHLRLNASMITPDDRLTGMRDWEYYRFVTFWCNFDPHVRNNAGYVSIDQRYCPFYVRVAGDLKKKCLVVEAVSEKAHEHSIDPPGPILSAPPLPATLDGQNFPEKPVSVAGSRRGRNEKAPRLRAARQQNGRVVKHRKRVTGLRKRRPPRAPLAALVPEAHVPAHDPSSAEARNGEQLAASIREDLGAVRSPKKAQSASKTPQNSNSPSQSGSPRAKALPRKGVEENHKCALCDFLCQSTEELVGHTWLRHQILTETWDLQ